MALEQALKTDDDKDMEVDLSQDYDDRNAQHLEVAMEDDSVDPIQFESVQTGKWKASKFVHEECMRDSLKSKFEDDLVIPDGIISMVGDLQSRNTQIVKSGIQLEEAGYIMELGPLKANYPDNDNKTGL